MLLPGCSLLNPLLQDLLLIVSQHLVRKLGRHALGCILRRNPLIQQTPIRIAADNHFTAFSFFKSAFLGVEPETNHTSSLIRPVAKKTVIRKDGADLTLKVNVGLLRRQYAVPHESRENQNYRPGNQIVFRCHREPRKRKGRRTDGG